MELADALLLLAGVWLCLSVLGITLLVAIYALETRERRPRRETAEVRPLRRTESG